jgi:hypothetical protein
MRRKPVVGDIIYYQLDTQNDGRVRAVSAKIEGVKEYSPRVRRKTNSAHKPKLLLFLLIIFLAIFVYGKFTKKIPAINTPVQQTQFKCDGRQHCSEMKSRAEAIFFLNNCPNTKMDGDRDGRPCERNSYF